MNAPLLFKADIYSIISAVVQACVCVFCRLLVVVKTLYIYFFYMVCIDVVMLIVTHSFHPSGLHNTVDGHIAYSLLSALSFVSWLLLL